MSALAIHRHRIASLLDLAVHQRLTIVVAPPGYGKTVLLAQWAHAHPRQRVRWLTLRPEDDDAATLARDLRDALGAPAPAPDRLGSARHDGGDLDGRPSFVTALFGELERVAPTTLVLDDFHILSNPVLLDDLAALIEHAPLSLRVVIATRVDPPPRYYRLGVSDALVELRQDDLAFTTEEARELVRRLTGSDLPADQIDKLVTRTEGWAVGLQLAALSLRERTDVAGFVDAFAGDDRHVADYLTEEVLRRQPEATRRFLLCTSVLDRMSGPLCDAVTGETGAQAMLEELDRSSMFVTRLDARRSWFRYHQLFRSLLRRHLHDEDADLERALLHRAATWHLERGELEVAVRYLAEAGAWDEVLGEAVADGPEMLALGRAAAIATWIELVPARVRAGDVGVQLLEAGALVVAGETGRASGILDAVDAAADLPAEPRVVADVLRAAAALQEGAPAEAVAGAERVLAALGELDESRLPDVLGLTSTVADVGTAARVVRGAGLTYLGRLDEARADLAAVPEGAHAMWQVGALGSLALVEAWSGRLSTADQLGSRALALARQCRLEVEPVTTDAYVALIEVAHQRGDLERARALLEEASRRPTSDRWRHVSFLLATEEALVALAEGQPAAGLTVLAARRMNERRQYPDALVARRRAVHAQLLLKAGDLDGAARTLDLAPLETSEVVAARARLAVERGDLRGARALAEGWPDRPRPRASLERRLWLAVLDHLGGDETAAQRAMLEVVAEAEIEQNVGLFGSRPALALARSVYREAPTPFLRSVVERPASASQARPVKELVEQLTEREFMVLPFLPTRLSNVEIAETLGVSLNTVKTHLKHIYRKLGVAGRSEAIAAAERLHLW
ncbi:MAG TPA: LuxR C-terminal-related transcriptional regulator [Acidimicrobiales bacterium]|nr:LuxR C-terminal-related transcriptional regulator [Acidimicrobiales bacterium]